MKGFYIRQLTKKNDILKEIKQSPIAWKKVNKISKEMFEYFQQINTKSQNLGNIYLIKFIKNETWLGPLTSNRADNHVPLQTQPSWDNSTRRVISKTKLFYMAAKILNIWSLKHVKQLYIPGTTFPQCILILLNWSLRNHHFLTTCPQFGILTSCVF